MHQGADGFGAQYHLIAGLDMLQFAGQRTVCDLDGIKLQGFIPGRRGNGIGAQQRFLFARDRIRIAHQTNHDKFARAEPQ